MEARFLLSDCAAIVYALKRQAAALGQTVAARALAYSALRNGRSLRRASKLPDERWGFAMRQRWDLLRQHAARALSGGVTNPCGRQWHWGGRGIPGDMERAKRAIASGKWREVKCREKTSNAFFERLTQ